jgi:hypothetical protein
MNVFLELAPTETPLSSFVVKFTVTTLPCVGRLFSLPAMRTYRQKKNNKDSAYNVVNQSAAS